MDTIELKNIDFSDKDAENLNSLISIFKISSSNNLIITNDLSSLNTRNSITKLETTHLKSKYQNVLFEEYLV